MNKKRTKISKISKMHFLKLLFRSSLFLLVFVLYIMNRGQNSEGFIPFISRYPLFTFIIWLVFVIEMLIRFFPSKVESLGCQKQFDTFFKQRKKSAKPKIQSRKRTFSVAVFWILLNSIIAILYYNEIIDAGILILISLFYSVSDMICILFLCPFQTWFMKNKCCTSCRIYNWDFAMMFTPLIFIKSFYTWSLFAIAFILFLRWEVSIRRYPERFAENTNAALSCGCCEEKLCHHKGQLRGFLEKNMNHLQLKGNVVLNSSTQNIKEIKHSIQNKGQYNLHRKNEIK